MEFCRPSYNALATCSLNSLPIKSSYLFFHSLKVVSRYRDPQLQMGENYSYLFNLIPNICKS